MCNECELATGHDYGCRQIEPDHDFLGSIQMAGITRVSSDCLVIHGPGTDSSGILGTNSDTATGYQGLVTGVD